MADKIVKEHVQEEIFVDYVLVPEHESRQNSDKEKEFNKIKSEMKQEMIPECFICKTKENLELHHFLVEDCENNSVDMNKLFELVKIFDVYGYGKKMTEAPKDDNFKANMMWLCTKHHREAEGIHNSLWNTWILQRITKEGCEPVIQDVARLKELKKEFKEEFQKKDN